MPLGVPEIFEALTDRLEIRPLLLCAGGMPESGDSGYSFGWLRLANIRQYDDDAAENRDAVSCALSLLPILPADGSC